MHIKYTMILICFTLTLLMGCNETAENQPDENIFIEENAQPLDESMVTYYYYDRLQGTEKELYCILYNNIVEMNHTIKIPEYIEYDIVNRIFNYVTYDHPEIFWLKGYEFTIEDSEMKLTMNQTINMDEIDELKNICIAYKKDVDKVVGKIKDEYEISRIVYQYLIESCIYGRNKNDQNILSVILNSTSICSGLSKTYQFLLQTYGIETVVVTGITAEEIPHMWNLIKIDGEYYYTCVTYGNTKSKNEEINYDYFNVKTSAMERIYRFNAGQILEPCTSDKANYYTRKGNVYTEIDKEKLKKQFNQGFPVEIRCADNVIYTTMKEYLIKNKGVYEYITNQKIKYETDDFLYKITFR